MSRPAAPPSYAEATARDKELGYGAPPYTAEPAHVPPHSVPIHPSWAFVHPSPSPGYTNPYTSDMSSPFSDPGTNGSCDGLSGDGWEDKNIQRMFIRKTLAMSYMAGMLASYHNTKVVMLCIGITAMVCLAVTLFCFQTKFLAFDVQLLMGNRRYSLSPEEHVFGALCLYMDIVYIFFFLLQLFGSRE
ncbi:UNVERIFIED_CONTAM: hypothetical protein FKN15_030469 [Acipenser sinensis]